MLRLRSHLVSEIRITHLKIIMKSIHTERLRHTVENLDEAFTTRTTAKTTLLCFYRPVSIDSIG